jgi:beta-lactam-binding protein with PASTA domain
MKLIARCVACLTLLGTLAACGGQETVMPDVTAKRLDIALSDLEHAGYGDEPEVLGGGMFGVIDEANWTVCDQSPAPGEAVTGTPRFTVDRSCEGLDEPESESENENESAEKPAKETSSAREASKPKAAKKRPRAVQGARASETFVMPFLVGANLQDAQDRLQSLGSYLLTQNDATGMERFQVLDSGWKVCGQFPAAGMKVSIARMVDLRVVKLYESCP